MICHKADSLDNELDLLFSIKFPPCLSVLTVNLSKSHDEFEENENEVIDVYESFVNKIKELHLLEKLELDLLPSLNVESNNYKFLQGLQSQLPEGLKQLSLKIAFHSFASMTEKHYQNQIQHQNLLSININLAVENSEQFMISNIEEISCKSLEDVSIRLYNLQIDLNSVFKGLNPENLKSLSFQINDRCNITKLKAEETFFFKLKKFYKLHTLRLSNFELEESLNEDFAEFIEALTTFNELSVFEGTFFISMQIDEKLQSKLQQVVNSKKNLKIFVLRIISRECSDLYISLDKIHN